MVAFAKIRVGICDRRRLESASHFAKLLAHLQRGACSHSRDNFRICNIWASDAKFAFVTCASHLRCRPEIDGVNNKDGCDPCDCDIAGCDPCGCDTDGCDSSGFDMDRCDPFGCDTDGCDLSGCDMDGYDPYGCDMDGCDPCGCDM
uniref:Keratin-associated protein 5-5-like n=1 Tax=Nicotiana tabacum TaxID=4097 RepID=A0A1S3YZN9_TOBAC|nr:PREDICTED: keratin-associated protein 5-5-like [Nicotiana tabacum]